MPPLLPPKIETEKFKTIMLEKSGVLNGSRHAVQAYCEKLSGSFIFAKNVDAKLREVRLILGRLVETDDDARVANEFIIAVRNEVFEGPLGAGN